MVAAFLVYLLCAITDCPPPNSQTSNANQILPAFPIRNRILHASRRQTSDYRFTRSSMSDDYINPIVSTRMGDIQGHYLLSRSGRKIAAFEGIPYARPPIGSRRFRNPEPAYPWNGDLLVANHTKMDCLQLDFSRMLFVRGAEDCLYLNVYSNHESLTANGKSIKTEKSLKPVIVFIHGGGWMSLSGSLYGPRFLLDKDCILVTFNFRLGVLGFLSTGNEGNFGLKDQALALKWVVENISAFGGNPKKITLMGESTGAGSVGLHMVSPLTAKVLPSIHGAILLSGGSMNHWAIMNDTVSNTKAIARRMQCPTDSSEKLVSCLRSRDPYMVVGQQMHLWTVPVVSRLLFGPVIESSINNPSAFLTESPVETYLHNTERIQPVPIISGITKNEGDMFAANVDMIPFLYSAINSQRDKMLAYLMAYDKHSSLEVKQTSEQISKFYFNNKRWSFNNRDRISDALGDRTITTGVYKLLQFHSQVAASYGYVFSHRSNTISSLGQMGLRIKDWGVSHGDELPFIFSKGDQTTNEFQDPKDLAMSKWLVEVFTNFANDRQPFPRNEVSENVTWSPIINPKYMEILEINEKKRMIPFPYLERMKFWERLHLD